MICLHHHPFPLGSAWLDQHILVNHEDFFEIIKEFSHIKAIVWGHVHQEFQEIRNGIVYLCTPSSSIQFLPHNDEFKLDSKGPGFRHITLNSNGTIETKVYRLENYTDGVDYDSKGY